MPRDEARVLGRRPPRVLFAPQEPRPLRPDAAADPALYRRWALAREAWRLRVDPAPAPGPEITLLMVVDGRAGAIDRGQTDAWESPDAPIVVQRTLAALSAQTVAYWSLSLTIVGPLEAAMDSAVAEALHGLGPGKVTMYTQATGTDTAAAYAAALEEIGTPAFALLEPGDELAPDAVAQLSAALLDADVAYADEDRVVRDGLTATPLLKPDWSPELLVSWSYVGRPVALRVAPVIAAGGIRALPGGDWEHDLLLRVTERTPRVAHVASVLCHRSRTAPASRGPAAVSDALARRGEVAEILRGPLPATWTVRRALGDEPTGTRARPTVSAIVPFRDSTTLLRACAESLSAGAAGTGGDSIALELVLVDNGSTEPETETLLELLMARLRGDVAVIVRRDDRPFNWAALNNAAAAEAIGEVLLFVNDDVQGGSPGWMRRLVAQALRPDVGAVGARLVYPDGKLQHAGIVLGLAGATGHVLAGLEPGLPGYLGMAVLTRDVSAVTGACMATRRDVFEQLGGFDEALGIDFNDVDYCLRARQRGLHVIVETGAELVHHESPSRGTSGSEETAAAFLARWGGVVDEGDPFYNRNLSHVDFSAALDEPGAVFSGAVPRTAGEVVVRSVR